MLLLLPLFLYVLVPISQACIQHTSRVRSDRCERRLFGGIRIRFGDCTTRHLGNGTVLHALAAAPDGAFLLGRRIRPAVAIAERRSSIIVVGSSSHRNRRIRRSSPLFSVATVFSADSTVISQRDQRAFHAAPHPIRILAAVFAVFFQYQRCHGLDVVLARLLRRLVACRGRYEKGRSAGCNALYDLI